MRFVIQRVQHAEVKVDGEVTGSIGKGFLVLIGVAETDTREIADKMINEALKVVSFQFLSGDSVINVCVNENHILMTVYVFLPCR